MERQLLLHLQALRCGAEVLFNGMPVASVGADGGELCLAVHEWTITGTNRLELVACAGIPGQPAVKRSRAAAEPTFARARLLLARQGQRVDDPAVRVLATAEWVAPEGKPFEAPVSQLQTVELPINFPRWRWLDAPPIPITAAVSRQVLEFVQQLALDLGRGHPDGFIGFAKLRFDELALAYQRPVEEGLQRFRDHLQQRYAAKSLKVVPPTAEELVLRPVHEGRLIDCVTPLGTPALRTQNDPAVGNHAWALRLAIVEGKIYVLR